MRIESLVGLAQYFADKDEVEFAVMLDSEEGRLFAVGLRNGEEIDEGIEDRMSLELAGYGAPGKEVKVFVMNSRHPSLLKYALKNGIPVFCRSESVMGEWFRRYLSSPESESQMPPIQISGLGYSGGY
jgi:hypothetical protein